MKQKKLFFVVSSEDVLKNFFLFPGGLFDKLKKYLQEGDSEVVIVMPSFVEKYIPRVREYSKGAENKVIIELIPSAQKLRGFQKLFTFFYSYLIYTGTTRTLATMGMRLDDAPGGGRQYLAPIKIILANTFGRSRIVKTKIVQYLYDFFFPERPLKEIFERHRPDLVFAPNLFKRFDGEVLREAKKQGVKSIGMVMNWDHLDKYYIPFHADFFLAQSEQTKSFAVNYQAYKENEIDIVGYPYIDFVIDKNYAIPRAETMQRLGFPPEARYILYIAGSMYCPDEPDIIEKILEWADKKQLGQDVRLVIRPYPGGRGRDKAFDKQKFDGFKNHPRVSVRLEKFWMDVPQSAYFMNIMRHADAVIAIYSTAVLEAVALDRPLLTTAFDGYHKRPFNRSVRRFELREHFRDVLETGGVRRAYSFEDLLASIKEYLRDGSIDAEKREKMRDHIIYKLDGRASERVLGHILNNLNA